MLKWCFNLLFALSCFAAIQSNPPHNYRLEGHGVLTQYMFEGSTNIVRYRFSIVCKDCNYNIKITYPTEKTGVPSTEWFYDGNQLLMSEQYADRPPGQELDSRGLQIITCNGYVFDGKIPAPTGCPANATLLWYLYASSCEIPIIKLAKRVRPLWNLDYEGLWLSGITYPAIISVAETQPALVKTLTVLNDGKFRILDPEDKLPRELEAPTPLNLGYTNAVITSDYTNHMSGLSFARTARIQRFHPEFGLKNPSSPYTKIVENEEIQLDKIVVPSDVECKKPQLKDRSQLIDRRPATTINNFSTSYGLTTNGQWFFLDAHTLQSHIYHTTIGTQKYKNIDGFFEKILRDLASPKNSTKNP